MRSLIAMTPLLFLLWMGCQGAPPTPGACSSDADCQLGLCDRNTNACVECLQNQDCSDGLLCLENKCTASSLGCKQDADCENAPKKFCSDAGKCELECRANSHCSGALKHCDRNIFQCVACLKTSDCAGDALCIDSVCRPPNRPNTCQSDADCQGSDKPHCSDAGKCEWACKDDAHCTGARAKCDRNSHSCVECLKSADCSGGKLCIDSLCKDPSANTGCKSDADCKGSFCSDAGKCEWACKDDAHCTGATSRCEQNSHRCVACVRSEHCPSGQVCLDQRCQTPSQLKCSSDSDCKANESCVGQICKPRPPECTQDSHCKAGQKCVAQKCKTIEKPECLKDSDCKSGERCVGQPPKCQPVVTKECHTHADCKSKAMKYCSAAGKCEWSCVQDSDCPSGYKCSANQCHQGTPSSACTRDSHCASGQACYKGRCARWCNPRKPGDCASSQFCVQGANTDVCLDRCDFDLWLKGQSPCPKHFYCKKDSSTYKPGYCSPLPEAPKGQLTLGATCSLTKDECNGLKDLFCNSEGLSGKCRQACSGPKECPSGHQCLFTSASFKGGICLPNGSGGLGDVCDDTTRRCKAGLTCLASLPIPVPGFKRVCIKPCDPQNGEFSNPTCGAGYYCTLETGSLPFPNATHSCKALPPKPTGSKQAGQPCASATDCDGSRSLVCYKSFCQKACNPDKGESNNPACSSGVLCKASPSSSYLGGACAKSTATLGENERCPSTAACRTGLICMGTSSAGHRCKRKCTTSSSNTCRSTESCLFTNQPTGGCYTKCTSNSQCTGGTTCTPLRSGTTKYCL